ncbi:MAG: alpha/beta hydrolase [Clostridia bacterium]|nr:alpha/beta hydrolase [Clostridia bacterium]
MKHFTETIDMGAGPRPLRAYIPDGTERAYYHGKRPAVVIFPGGGYYFTYEGEAEPIALCFAAAGACAFVLDYTTTGEGKVQKAFPYAQLEAFAAIRYVREHAEEFGIDPENVSTLGFSAGGHLCGCTGTLWNKPIMKEYLSENARLSRPDKLILCYAVIRSMEPCNEGSFENLLGKSYAELTEEELRPFALEEQVDDETPPAYIWMTAEETCVPIQGALDFARALADHKTHAELHLYPHGDHGSCLGNHVTEELPFSSPMGASDWMTGAIRFVFDDKLKEKLQ